MEAACSSETSVAFQRTPRRYTPADVNFHNQRCENLKSYNKLRMKERGREKKRRMNGKKNK
jgi:hypothetical protein